MYENEDRRCECKEKHGIINTGWGKSSVNFKLLVLYNWVENLTLNASN